MPRSKKRVKLSLGEDEQVPEQNGFSINKEYAQRFEHNKRREEKDRLMEKAKQAGGSDDESSSSEEEDDQGELATEALDSEIMATLKALKSKDPSIYDKNKQFYRPIEDDDAATGDVAKTSKPMYLSDYHRQKYLSGDIGGNEEDEEPAPIQTYDQEQETLRQSVVKAMHGDESSGSDDDDDGDDGLLVKKTKPASDALQKAHKSKPVLDVENADRDPETFLSNFMTSRAWVPEEGSRFANLDEDDSEEERLAETFEEAYNLRFEDPSTANEKMTTYARDSAKYSARRDAATGRKQKRDKKKEAKDQVKADRESEKARLRNLKIDDIEHKVKRIREAAGIGPTETVDLDEWRAVLGDDDFDDDKWEEIMAKKFGDSYYATRGDNGEDDDSDDEVDFKHAGKKHHKKPTWDEDIYVADIAPELHESDSEDDDPEDADQNGHSKPEAAPQTVKVNPQDKRRAARQQRAAIEALVDNQMVGIDTQPDESQPAPMSGFRYRETSPGAFGLSSRDILFANDKQLNEFASMKKHHAFRDEDRKRKDRKKLNSRAQRTWRKEVFGTEDGYQGDFADFVREQEAGNEIVAARKQRSSHEHKSKDKKRKAEEGAGGVDGEGKKKRRRKKKATAEA